MNKIANWITNNFRFVAVFAFMNVIFMNMFMLDTAFALEWLGLLESARDALASVKAVVEVFGLGVATVGAVTGGFGIFTAVMGFTQENAQEISKGLRYLADGVLLVVVGFATGTIYDVFFTQS